jgi:beta-mannosidase
MERQYEKFNQWEKGQVEKLDPTRRFWPDSPSDGTFNYSGVWQRDSAGDMHYWEVWHGSGTFESFYKVHPRFCSEFGYQSYPSLPTVKTFCPPSDYDIQSPSFGNHQKNNAGNDIIANMFSTYFKLPTNFLDQLYLSQAQQSLAIRMGVEFWRTLKPAMRGTLYWQLNDCWPVSSWSSLEYTGRWKQLHYHAKRFSAPVLASFIETKEAERLDLFIVNDRPAEISVQGKVQWIGFDGSLFQEWTVGPKTYADDGVGVIWNISTTLIEQRRGLGFFWADFKYAIAGQAGEVPFDNWFFPALFKLSEMQVADIMVTVTPRAEPGTEITLVADKPAFFVTLESEAVRVFSDSSFVLVPGVPKVVTCPETITAEQLTVYQLNKVGVEHQ